MKWLSYRAAHEYFDATKLELEAKIQTLSPDEKAHLIRSLIAQLDGPADADVDAAWVKEAQRRHREFAEGTVEPVPGEQVCAKLRERLKR